MIYVPQGRKYAIHESPYEGIEFLWNHQVGGRVGTCLTLPLTQIQMGSQVIESDAALLQVVDSNTAAVASH
jgi:hypothetical protein